LNTFFDEFSEIIVPVEEIITSISTSSGEDPRGGVAVIDIENNLTYMDIKIINSIGGGGGNGGG
jgi:hypothetical protein